MAIAARTPTTTSPTTDEARAARSDAVLPPDAEAIMQRALAEEGPPAVKGIWRLDRRQLRYQRRMTLLLTIGPLVGTIAAIVLLWGAGAGGIDLALFVSFYAFTGLGVTVGYHRLFTHRSFEVPIPIRLALAVAGSMSMQNSIIEWVATHRRHHAYADEYGDPHSPHLLEKAGLRGVLRGLWHAHLGWFLAPERTDTSRWAPDLEADPLIARIDRAFPLLTGMTLALPAVLGGVLSWSLVGAATGLLWGGLLRIFLLHHVTWSINSICHFYGQRPFDTRDESTNSRWLSLLSFGESWHNNHHAFPTSARHGLLRWQLDPSWRVIRTLEQLKLASNVRRVSRRMLERKRAAEARLRARR